MQKRKFDELISHFNRKVSDMSIDQKYKMELLGMISAIGFAHEKEHGTNLASLGTNCSEFPNNSDAISRQSVIEMLDETKRIARQNIDGAVLMTFERVLDSLVNITNAFPSIQPDNGLQKLADEIASFKRCVKSDNSDYLTGYLCALSVVEGMIADMRQKGEDSESN